MFPRIGRLVIVDALFILFVMLLVRASSLPIQKAPFCILYLFVANIALWLYYQPGAQRKQGLWRTLARLSGWTGILLIAPGNLVEGLSSGKLVSFLTMIYAILLGIAALFAAEIPREKIDGC
jgi:hypothetical protein